jgi:hypothetical protein
VLGNFKEQIKAVEWLEFFLCSRPKKVNGRPVVLLNEGAVNDKNGSKY